MTQPVPPLEDVEEAAEARALAEAVAAADSDPRSVPHAIVRAWLQQLAEGDFAQPPPEPR